MKKTLKITMNTLLILLLTVVLALVGLIVFLTVTEYKRSLEKTD